MKRTGFQGGGEQEGGACVVRDEARYPEKGRKEGNSYPEVQDSKLVFKDIRNDSEETKLRKKEVFKDLNYLEIKH